MDYDKINKKKKFLKIMNDVKENVERWMYILGYV